MQNFKEKQGPSPKGLGEVNIALRNAMKTLSHCRKKRVQSPHSDCTHPFLI